jgi:N-acetylglucosamine-6-phosphate deacetylase
MAASTPAAIMKINDKKGSLEVGKDADIVIFDKDIHIKTTIIKGRIIYETATRTSKRSDT